MDQLPTNRVVLGTLGADAVGWVDDDGVTHLAATERTIRWWVVAEDRTHVTEREPSTRRRRVDHAPVVEAAVKVPGGDVVGRAFAFVGADRTGASVAFEVVNRTAVPVAIAFVVGPGPVEIGDDGRLLVDGREAWTSGRRVSSVLVAPDVESLMARVGVDDPSAPGSTGRWGAVVVPLPHSQTAWAISGPGGASAPPSSDQVASGWSRQVDRGTRLELGDGSDGVDWETARRDLLVTASGGDRPIASDLAALVRLGWVEEASLLTDRLIGEQRARGWFDGPDRVIATIDAVDALGGWARSGVPGAALEHLAEPVGRAAAWLSRWRWRAVPAEWRGAATRAVRDAAPLMALVGQQDAATALALTPVADPGPDRTPRTPETPGQRIVAVLDSVAAETAAGLDLAGCLDPGVPGRSLELFDLPTRWGLLSFAVRWHGERPAVLWEIEPWEDGRPLAPPVLRSSRLDDTWAGAGLRGDALLRIAVAG